MRSILVGNRTRIPRLLGSLPLLVRLQGRIPAGTRTRIARFLKPPPLPVGLRGPGTDGGTRTLNPQGLSLRPLPGVGLRRRTCRGRDSNPHCAPSRGAASCQLGYRDKTELTTVMVVAQG